MVHPCLTLQLLVIGLDDNILATLVVCLNHAVRVPLVVRFDHNIRLLLSCVSVVKVEDRCCTMLDGHSIAVIS